MREDERGPTDPAGDFKHGARVGGNKSPTAEGLSVDLLGKTDEVDNLVDSPLVQKRVERPPAFRRKAESSVNRDLGVSVQASPNLKNDHHRMARW